ncbi:hypothetical protein [Mucilaginibacter sp. UYCu711]|uniref:hypothetical protein n=1 Tax=Mucilaginibacter sp. UYCu711 TaxID=3156339 RepID=UPI003D2587C3
MIKSKFNVILLVLYATVLLFAGPMTVHAQEFGGNPPSLKWKQVNVPAAKVIFPAGMDSIATRVADIINRMDGATKPTIGFKQKQISIVLQNQTTISNAYVGLAPFRSEFYLTPDQNSFEIGTLPWADQLAIHEFRHVQQYNNFNVGLSRGLRFLFGDAGQAFGNDLAIPNWFFEGDAVFNETHVSQQGRGRLPYFFNGYRALWTANKNYSWMKLRNGSLIDYVPDWYPMGYMMVAYGREKYGDDFWRKVTHDAASYHGLFYPMQRAIKKYSGEDFKQFHSNGLNYFKEQVAYNSTNLPATQNRHFIASEEYPAYVNPNTVIYMKSTYNRLPQFTINTNGQERKISVRSLSLDNYFNYNKDKIVYAALKPDERWSYRDYNELRVLDVTTGEERRLTKRTKYFSPAFNDDGKRIVAVQVAASGKNELHILNAVNGKVLSVVPNKANLFYTYPKFYNDRQLVAAVRNAAGQMSLAVIDIRTGDARYLLAYSYQPIGVPFIQGSFIYFSATAGVTDRLFAVNISSGKLFEIDREGINKYQPTAMANKLAWVEFTAFGYRLQEAENNLSKWRVIPDNKVPGELPDFKISALKRDSATDLLPTVEYKPLAVTRYSKAHHLFNFHSLIPDFNDPNYTVSLQGDNILNTFQSQLLFSYNSNEGYKEFGFDAVYGALFPFISAGFDYTLDRRARYQGISVYWNESDLHAGLQVPLNLSSGKHLTGLNLTSSLHYSTTSFQQTYQAILNKAYTYVNSGISFTNRIQQARQNIYPRWGQSIAFNYKRAISGLSANQFLATGSLYLPGLFINHNLVVTGAYQHSGQDNVVSFSNNFPFSRGYTAENLLKMNKVGVNYHFPIAYPDAGIANTVYFLRIRGNLFYDYTEGTYFYTNKTMATSNFRSTGAELYFDTKWFNQEPLTLGIRYSRLLDKDVFGGVGPDFVELVLPVSFY